MDAFESVARAAVEEAGRRLRAAWGKSQTIEYKGTVDFVTETDRQVERLIVDHVQQSFPGHLIIGEEASADGQLRQPVENQYAWYIDPLDGTTNFIHSFPQFAVSVALTKGRELVFGIVHDPIREETFEAQKGGGATLNGTAIRVSTVSKLSNALLATGFPYDRREHADFYLGFWKDFMLRSHGVRRAGSAALDLCYVACGRFDGFWEWKLHPWDTAAGALIVREAGGMVTNFSRGPFDIYAQQTLATNGRIHSTMVEVLTQRLDKAQD